MKLRNIRPVGRYRRPDGKEVNVRKGTRVGRSETIYFWTFRNKRQITPIVEFYNNWEKVS